MSDKLSERYLIRHSQPLDDIHAGIKGLEREIDFWHDGFISCEREFKKTLQFYDETKTELEQCKAEVFRLTTREINTELQRYKKALELACPTNSEWYLAEADRLNKPGWQCSCCAETFTSIEEGKEHERMCEYE